MPPVQLASRMTRPLGTSGIAVSTLGFGGGCIGSDALSDHDAGILLREAVDLGVTLFDTARSYGLSEERIGRHLAPVRDRVVLSTKIGYGVEGVPDWTFECVARGIHEARARLRADVIDIVHLHSCPTDVLARGEVIDALTRAADAGRIRIAAYAGDNDALSWAVESGRFASVQTSVNICDRASLGLTVPDATSRGLGVIAKRTLANACWRHGERPARDDVAIYWDRWRTLAPDGAGPLPADELALRFAAFAPGVSACLVGTSSVEHLRRAIAIVERGPLDADTLGRLQNAWDSLGRAWPGIV